ncbi:MAG: Eco57I restriction-modification methylase domain-containing protein [Tannerella sp.]|uniref:Eco57I restriction-modification methylase domain-containing protein n=1 Tax=Coprobacter fastidiosus TaxID=1099853 RepID=UPI00262D03FA|nr:Eco57I restriction-modification methylase domain-containing protein [Coprobacter fastidiosus]MBS6268118.1 Eco57I restriction-modification methylase domain-containing protein [Tannerella sp.]
MEKKKQIADLVSRFEQDLAYYKSDRYNETLLRSDFLDPLFELLGWDIKNTQGKSTNEREVLLEESLKANALSNTKKPDYTFRLFSERKFFLEAKKPHVKIELEDTPAKQVRRYGYTAGLHISVLSNFEYLYIYDTTIPVDENDNREKGLVKSYHYSEFVSKFDEISSLLSHNSVYNGDFDKIWEHIERNVEHKPIDKLFLEQINRWRLALANEIYRERPDLTPEQLSDIVQSYINKLLFLRVCEDRSIETYQELLSIAEKDDAEELVSLFHKADLKYNSGLFDEFLAPQLIGNISSTFWDIVRQLYYPETPYSFAVLSSDILGRIYEIFLSKRLAVIDGSLVIVDKPENVDRDVVTTPTYIIQEILRRVVLPKVEGKDLQQLCELKFADIACGSGAFLLELFQLLCDVMLDYYIQHSPDRLYKAGVNGFRLPYSIKVKILTNCIYGVDKDYNATEATKFGLLLKVLEGEDVNSLADYKPILPSLSQNILFGNSLLGSNDVRDNKLVEAINTYDFGDLKFNVVIGNPPYMSSEDMKNLTPLEYPLYPSKYDSAYKQYDKYFLFIERGLQLLKDDGGIGYIIPSKFMKVGAALKLRDLISRNHYLSELASFGANQVFDGKTTYTCLLILSKQDNYNFKYEEISNISRWRGRTELNVVTERQAESISSDTWALFPEEFDSLFDKIHRDGYTLSNAVGSDNIFNGIQTSANKTYIFQPLEETETTYSFQRDDTIWKIEKNLTKPYFKTVKDYGLSSYNSFRPNARVIFPYFKDENGKLQVIPLKELASNYPLGYSYIIAHKHELNRKNRDIKPVPENDNEWHRYGRHQSLEACELPCKLIVGVLSQGEKYAVDVHGTLVSSGGTAGYCIISLPEESPYSIYYLQALLTSRPLEWISSLYGEIFRGGFIARGTKVLKQLPFRTIDFDNHDDKKLHDDISALQQELISIGDRIVKVRNNNRVLTPLKRNFSNKKKEMKRLIQKLFCLTEEEYYQIPKISDIYATI